MKKDKVDRKLLASAIDAYGRHKGYGTLKEFYRATTPQVDYETMRRALDPVAQKGVSVEVFVRIMVACDFPRHQIKNILMQAGDQIWHTLIATDDEKLPEHLAASFRALLSIGSSRPDLWPSLVSTLEGFAKAAGVELSDDVLKTMKGE